LTPDRSARGLGFDRRAAGSVRRAAGGEGGVWTTAGAGGGDTTPGVGGAT
jgi:hypothetical protein